MTLEPNVLELPQLRLAYGMAVRPGAETVVLAHSLFMDRSMFDTLVERLATDFTVVAYDARGHGASSSARDGRADMDAAYDDAAALIEALGVGPVHFAGNSMGGFTALRLAARRPDLVRSVTAMGSSGDAEEQLEAFGGLVAHIGASGGSGVEDALGHVFFGDDCLVDPAFDGVRKKWIAHFAGLAPAMANFAAGVVHRSAILPELQHSQVPVLAMAGAQDHSYPATLSERIASTAPRGQLAVIAGAGHSVAMEKPAETEAALRGFLANLPTA